MSSLKTFFNFAIGKIAGSFATFNVALATFIVLDSSKLLKLLS